MRGSGAAGWETTKKSRTQRRAACDLFCPSDGVRTACYSFHFCAYTQPPPSRPSAGHSLGANSPWYRAGRLRAVVAALRIHVETTPEARRCIHYVFGNRHRMRYPQFRAKGLCISSGVVEAGCKQIGARLKRAGMRWTVAGANAIIAPSAAACSAAASRTSGSDEPQTPPGGRLTMMSCTPGQRRLAFVDGL